MTFNISYISGLNYLISNQNYLTGTIPKELSEPEVLIEVYLEDNLLTGTLPSQLGNSNNLR